MSTVLIVEDSALPRECIARLLEHEGYEALRAANGKEGWAVLYDHTPDLVLLDLMMPEMDGITLLRMIRRSDRWHDLPVVVLTGAGDDDQLISRARQLKIQELIPKGEFGWDELLTALKRHMPTIRN